MASYKRYQSPRQEPYKGKKNNHKRNNTITLPNINIPPIDPLKDISLFETKNTMAINFSHKLKNNIKQRLSQHRSNL
jgi:hypothetical protein